jgi:hypothetical protein
VVSRHDGEGGEVHLSVKLDDQAVGQFGRLFPGALANGVDAARPA